MHTVPVGIMLPTSTIRPMSKQFLKAFKKASAEMLEGSDYELEIISEMIGNGSPDLIEKALDQFFGFHEVEMVTGFGTRYGIQHSIDKFQKKKVPLLLCGLGEHFIPTKGYNEHVFINSLHLWQQSWYLGYFAGKNLGAKGMVFSAMYDSGYSFLPAFQQGVFAANPDCEFSFKLLPMSESGELSPIAESFDHVEFAEQDFVFSILCGEEATIFLDEFKKRELHKDTALLGMPYLLEAGEADLSGVSLYTAHHKPEQASEDPTLKNAFAELGQLSGQALAKAVLIGKGEVDKGKVAEALEELDKGRVYPSVSSPKLKTPISIVKHVFGQDNVLSTEIIESKEINLDDDEVMNSARDEASSNWVNPYLAI